MAIYINDGWLLFCIAFFVVMLTSFIMSLQGINFYTLDPIKRRFSMMDLQLPSSAKDLANIIRGIYNLPQAEANKTLKNLRGQLYLDFIFMPAAYGCIFLACMKISLKMVLFGKGVFAVLAWAQLLAWLLDIIENITILKRLKPNIERPSGASMVAFRWLEIGKWGISLTGMVCSASAMAYFWVMGNYEYNSLQYIVTIIAELAVFFVAGKVAAKKYKQDITESI